MKKLLMNKKVISFIMVLTLVFCASSTAFALTPVDPDYPIDVTVEFSATAQTITDYQNVQHSISAVDVENEVYYASEGTFSTEFTVPSGATHELAGYPTVMDAIYNAYEQYDSSMTGFSMGWDTYSDPNGAYVSTLFGDGTITTASGSNYWGGYSWAIYLNGDLIDLYASNVQIEDDDEIEIKYEYSYLSW